MLCTLHRDYLIGPAEIVVISKSTGQTDCNAVPSAVTDILLPYLIDKLLIRQNSGHFGFYFGINF
jgi:hypothetical protein